MKRFKFSLDSVLLVKEKALEDENIKLSIIKKTLENQKECLQKTIENLFKYQDMPTINFNPMIIGNQIAYINRLKEQIETQKNIIKETEKKVENQQKKVQQAYIEVKSLEKLEEKKKKEYKKEISKKENKILDDIVNSRRQFYKKA